MEIDRAGAFNYPRPTCNGYFFLDQVLHVGPMSSAWRFRESASDAIAAWEVSIAREVERRMIREEIMMAEISRRRELEAKVLREMMMERESALHVGHGLSLFDSPFSSMRSVPLLHFLHHQVGFPRIERKFPWRRDLEGGFNQISTPANPSILGVLPSQRRPRAAKPMKELSKGQTALVKRMNGNMAGIKRKFETRIFSGDSRNPSVSLTKKTKTKWNCALCQVSARTEQGLNDHLKGKKHRMKEKALQISTETIRSYANVSNPLPKETENSIEISVHAGSVNPNLGKADLKKINKGKGSLLGEKQSTAELKMTDFKFWCKLCNFGTTSEVLMTYHRKGEGHMTLLQENGGSVISIKTMPDVAQYIKKTKNTATAEGKYETLVNADGAKLAVFCRTDDTVALEGMDGSALNTDAK